MIVLQRLGLSVQFESYQLLLRFCVEIPSLPPVTGFHYVTHEFFERVIVKRTIRGHEFADLQILADGVDDRVRQVDPCSKHEFLELLDLLKALQKRRRELRVKQSRLLLRQTKGDHESATSEIQIEDCESKQLLSQEEKKRLGRLRAKQSRWKNKRQELSQKIGKLSLELAQLDEQSKNVEKTQSRLE